MTHSEPPMITVLLTLLLALAYIACGENGGLGRYRLFHDIAEVTRDVKFSHTCDDYGFFTAKGTPNCIEKNGFRYQNTGTFLAFYRMDAVSVPHPVWTASLDPYSRPNKATLEDLRAIHSAFVED